MQHSHAPQTSCHSLGGTLTSPLELEVTEVRLASMGTIGMLASHVDKDLTIILENYSDDDNEDMRCMFNEFG